MKTILRLLLLITYYTNAGVGVVGNGGGKWEQLQTPLQDFPIFDSTNQFPTQWFWIIPRSNLLGETQPACLEFYTLYQEALHDLKQMSQNNSASQKVGTTILTLLNESTSAQKILKELELHNFKNLCDLQHFEGAYILDSEGNNYIAANDPKTQKLYLDIYAWNDPGIGHFSNTKNHVEIFPLRKLKKAFALHEILGMTVARTEQKSHFTYSSLYLDSLFRYKN